MTSVEEAAKFEKMIAAQLNEFHGLADAIPDMHGQPIMRNDRVTEHKDCQACFTVKRMLSQRARDTGYMTIYHNHADYLAEWMKPETTSPRGSGWYPAEFPKKEVYKIAVALNMAIQDSQQLYLTLKALKEHC